MRRIIVLGGGFAGLWSAVGAAARLGCVCCYLHNDGPRATQGRAGAGDEAT